MRKEHLEAERKGCLREVYRAMIHLFSVSSGDFSQSPCATWDTYVATLINEGIWPESIGFNGIRLQTIFDKVRSLPDFSFKSLGCEDPKDHIHCIWWHASFSQAGGLADTCSRLEEWLSGRRGVEDCFPCFHLCLDCLKQGASPSWDAETACEYRVAHKHTSVPCGVEPDAEW